jgi:hypothetical protein
MLDQYPKLKQNKNVGSPPPTLVASEGGGATASRPASHAAALLVRAPDLVVA